MARKLNKTVIFVIVLSVAVVAALVLTRPSPEQSPTQTVIAGVAAGDAFTYSISGFATIIDANATIPESFFQLNKTESYKVMITSVNGTEVSFNATWRFLNGTEIKRTGKVNIETGIGNSQDFWAIYASGLKAGDRDRPFGMDRPTINSTEIRSYKDSGRETNSISQEQTFYETNDTTLSHPFKGYRDIYFDKQTGMLVEFVEVSVPSSPQIILRLRWKLVDSSVWDV